MAVLSIPIPRDTAFFRTRVALDGVDFLLDFAWNTRASAWTISLLTSGETALVTGLRIVSNRPILKRFRYLLGMPAGELLAHDPTAQFGAPNYTQLGAEIPLLYYDAEEISARTP